jgi:drug/metabolite transporter (DMT)-like permease
VFHRDAPGGTFRGVALVQLSNAAFALGQVLYRRVRARMPPTRDRDVFALLYAGAFAVAASAFLAAGRWPAAPGPLALTTLLYLGIVASGVGFFLWNLGATRVNSGTLAVMNNAKVPLGVACSLLFFGESADPGRLLCSFLLFGTAVWLAEPR